MKEFLTWVCAGLVPPHGTEGNDVYRWRVTVAVMIMANSFGIIGLSAVAFGFAPVLFHGFASADAVHSVREQFAQIQTNQLDAKIMDTRTRQCRAIVTKNETALQFATERLQAELNEYMALTNKRYRLPECSEV
jgi:hypothetical protein